MSAYISKGLSGIESAFFFNNGNIKECILGEKNIVHTKYGSLIPKYGPDEVRKKYNHSISFYESGVVKSIALEASTPIETPLGIFPAELVTFYESGALKRIFPLNGKISGYWTEADEGKLCEEFRFNFPFGSFCAKIISLCFYESGNLKSLTLWPGETVTLSTPAGTMPVRIGFSLFECGKLKSVEPADEITVSTPIGDIKAYDENALGINADKNSLCFCENGCISSLLTCSNKVTAFESNGEMSIIKPVIEPDPIDEEILSILPLKISFEGHYVNLQSNTSKLFDINTTRFTIIKSCIPPYSGSPCQDCFNCSLCKTSISI